MDKSERRSQALEKLKSFGLKLPADWKFDRDEANVRSDGTDISVAPLPETSSPRLRS
ncbi:virulence-associated protein VagC [Rhizobium sp. BK602]|nr:virulence-associated protein VagC [Rhizobium sp. BK602]